MTLHVDPFVFWWAVLLLAAAAGVPLNRWRRDIARVRAAKKLTVFLQERVEALEELADARAERIEALEQLRAAESDEWALRELHHKAVCLGGRVIPLERCS